MDPQPPAMDLPTTDAQAVDPFSIRTADHLLICDKITGAVLVNKNGRMAPADQETALSSTPQRPGTPAA